MWYGNTSEVKEFFSNFGTVTLVETSDSSIISGTQTRHLLISKSMRCPCFFPSPGVQLSQLVPRWSWKWISPQACPEASLSSASSMRHPSSLFGGRAAEGRAVRWSGAAAGKVDVMFPPRWITTQHVVIIWSLGFAETLEHPLYLQIYWWKTMSLISSHRFTILRCQKNMPILHAKPPDQDPGKQRDDENCRKADRSETCQGQVRGWRSRDVERQVL